jgi:hypothetical protein
MNKRYAAVLIVFLILQTLTILVAYPQAAGEEFFQWYVTDEGNIINGYLGRETRITIPESINGKPVIEINISDQGWLVSLTMAKEISIPSSVIRINLDGVRSINTLTDIDVDPGNPQFSSLNGILYNRDKTEILCIPCGRTDTSITLPASIRSLDFSYHEPANILCQLPLQNILVDPANPIFSSLDGVLFSKDQTTLICYPRSRPDSVWTVPSSIRQIGEGAFYNCESLQQIILPEALGSIGDFAFMGCAKLTDMFLPKYVSALGSYAFKSCNRLQSISVDDNNLVYSSSDGVLFDKSKTSLIKYPPKKTSIDYTTPDSVTSIEAEAFIDCWQLNQVKLGDQVSLIGARAFENCWNLLDIELPGHISQLGPFTFSNCNMLTQIELPASISEIPEGLLDSCSNLKRVILPEHVTRVGQDAFSGCRSLQDIRLPDDISQIGSHAFDGCDLRQIVLPAQLTEIADALFSDCGSLSDVTIRGKVTKIGSGAFQACKQLTKLVLPASVISIADGTLAGPENLESITVEEGNTAFTSQDGVLYNQDKSSLLFYPPARQAAEYTMPDRVIRIMPDLFHKTLYLKKIVLSNNIKVLEPQTFLGSTQIEQIQLPDGLTKIGIQAFTDCVSLTRIDLPASLTWIDAEAFSQCISLESVLFWGEAPYLGQQAFNGCGTGLTLYYLTDNQASFTGLDTDRPMQPFLPERLMVRFINWDGHRLDTEFVLPGKAARSPIVPVRDGYQFTGWDKIFDHVYKDMTVTAQFSEKTPNPSYKGPASIVAGVALIVVLVAAGLIFGKRIRRRQRRIP